MFDVDTGGAHLSPKIIQSNLNPRPEQRLNEVDKFWTMIHVGTGSDISLDLKVFDGVWHRAAAIGTNRYVMVPSRVRKL